MSVPSEARSRQTFKPIEDARRLCAYSLQVLKNNRNFKSYPSGDEEDDSLNPPQPELVAMMQKTAMEIYICAFSANDIYFSATNYQTRRRLQDKSIAKCRELGALVELTVPIFHTPLKKVEFWTEQIRLVRDQIQAWKESDYQRYKRITAKGRTGGPGRRTSVTTTSGMSTTRAT